MELKFDDGQKVEGNDWDKLHRADIEPSPTEHGTFGVGGDILDGLHGSNPFIYGL